MSNKKRINWWIVAAVLIIGIPVGFVATGIINKTMSEKNTEATSTAEDPGKDTGPEVAEVPIVAEPETADTTAVVSVQPTPKPEPAVKKTVPKKTELTPEQIAEQEYRQELKRQQDEEKKLLAEQEKREQQELKRQQEEEKRLIAEQKKQESQRKIAEEQEAKRKKAEAAQKAKEAEQARIQEQFVADVKSVIASGKSSSKVPEDCIIVVNNQRTNYQDFRNGVRLGSYSGIRVVKVEGNGVATKVYVNATVNAADD